MAAETLKRLWEDLQKGRSDGAKVLSEINTLLVSSVSDVKEIVPELPLAPLFGNLNCDNVELVRVTSSVLEKLLDLMPLELVCQLSTYVEVGLQHSEHSVIELSVRQLKRYCSSAESRSLVLAPTMLHLIMQMLDSENLDLSKSAHDLILLISRGDRRSLLVDRKEVFASDLRLLLEKNSTVRFRVYELLIDIGAQSDDALSEVLDLRILQTLLTELESSDVLVQLNCLEMMSQLLTTARGFEYVQSSGVIEQVYKVLVTARNDPFIIIIPGIIKFFGVFWNFSLQNNTLTTKYPVVMEIVIQVLPDPANSVWPVAMETIGVLGTRPGGRILLSSNKMDVVLKALSNFLMNSKTEIRVKALEALSLLLSYNELSPHGEALSQEWCDMLGKDFLSHLLTLANQPFPDLSTAALKCTLAVSGAPWGQSYLQRTPGFIEYLLNRRASSCKQATIIKHSIVTALVQDLARCEAIFGQSICLKFQAFQQEGPFHVTGENIIDFQNS